MRKFLKVLLLVFLMLPCFLYAKEKELNIYLFYGNGCPHCKAEEEFLNKYLKDNKDVKLHKYEIWYDKENLSKLEEVMKIMKVSNSGIPFLVIGNTPIVGYDESYTPIKIKDSINYYKTVKFKDEVGIYLGVVDEYEQEDITPDKKDDGKKEIVIPIIGKKDIKSVSILLCAVIIGLVDGFNPCAMWILIFLISMLLGIKDSKRKWGLGIAFLLSSGVVYFLFLVSWLNLATFLNKIEYIRVGIATLALVFGIISVYRFLQGLKKDDGCEVVDSNNRKRIINSIKKIVKEKSFVLALLGIVLLAFSVNVIELLCSLGLPVMFSEILAINNVSNSSKIIYSIIYVLFFLIDDIVVFIIAMKTLEIKAISNKFGKYSHLIGGIIMIIIGLLMVYKPEWLMFNF